MGTQSNQSSQVYQKVIVKGVIENSKYLTNIEVIKINDASIQQVSDTVYIVRGYKNGENHPKPHEWSVTVVTEGGLYQFFGFTKIDNGSMRISQTREVHKFFKEMGLRAEYKRSRAILNKLNE